MLTNEWWWCWGSCLTWRLQGLYLTPRAGLGQYRAVPAMENTPRWKGVILVHPLSLCPRLVHHLPCPNCVNTVSNASLGGGGSVLGRGEMGQQG